MDIDISSNTIIKDKFIFSITYNTYKSYKSHKNPILNNIHT